MDENRSWKHKAPFWFLLHASKAPARKKDLITEAKHTPQLYDWRLTSPRGEIVALVHVASIRRMSEKDFYKPFCSGPLIWELDRVLPLTTPVPIKGALQLYAHADCVRHSRPAYAVARALADFVVFCRWRVSDALWDHCIEQLQPTPTV
jgi:hypothetical protein